MRRILIQCIALLFILCEYTGNKFDPSSPGFLAPSLTIDSGKTTISDTIFTDSVTIALKNNAEKNIFYRWKLDSLSWSGWSGYGDELYYIKIRELQSGIHSVIINATYNPMNVDNVDSSFSFFLLPAPEIKTVSDTLIKAAPGAQCTLWVKATGDSLTYTWYADTTKISDAANDTFVVDNINQTKAITYYCNVSNKRSTVKSPLFRISVLLRILYDGNTNTAGIVPVDSNVYTRGDSATVMSNNGNLTKVHCTFTGWNTRADGSGKSLKSDTVIIIDSSTTIFAQWRQNPVYTIQYFSNGADSGIVPIDTNTYESGDSVTVASNSGNLRKIGLQFIGWSTDSTGNDANEFKPGSILIVDSSNVKLYSKWSVGSKNESLWDGFVWDVDNWE